MIAIPNIDEILEKIGLITVMFIVMIPIAILDIKTRDKRINKWIERDKKKWREKHDSNT